MLGMAHLCPLLQAGLDRPESGPKGIVCLCCFGEERTRPEGGEFKSWSRK